MHSSQEGGRTPIAVVTGGTGIVGSALSRFLERDLPGHRIIKLSRRQGHDIGTPGLGLDSNLAGQIEEHAAFFVHCAADTRFNLSLDEARHTNTAGTRNVLDIALRCRNLKQFAHISTLYIAGRRAGVVREEPLVHDAGYVNTYEQSKHEAESLVLAESSRLPVGIYRLSSVIDDHGSGGHVRQLLRFIPWCDRFPYFPAEASVPVDLIGSEWAASRLSVLIARHFTPNCMRHICAGKTAPTVRQLMDRIFKGKAQPRLVSLREFQQFPAFGNAARALESMMTFIPHLSIHQPFDNAITAQLI